jgi:hypothetical protein
MGSEADRIKDSDTTLGFLRDSLDLSIPCCVADVTLPWIGIVEGRRDVDYHKLLFDKAENYQKTEKEVEREA